MSARLRILLVEDDARIRAELVDALRAAEFDVDVSPSLADARWATRSNYDLIVLDLGLPDGDGLDLCRELRAEGRAVPILVLTARDAPEQRVRGLDVGADDYLVKPFHMPELLARTRSLLRRVGRTPGGGPIRCGDLWVDASTHSAGVGERVLDLKPREFDLLAFFLRHPDRAWTRDQLLDRVWGTSYDGETRTVDNHVRRLRAVIEDDPSDPRRLTTVWGVGYRLRDES